MVELEFIEQQCNYCGKKQKFYGEIVLYTDPYGDRATNNICVDCYLEHEGNKK